MRKSSHDVRRHGGNYEQPRHLNGAVKAAAPGYGPSPLSSAGRRQRSAASYAATPAVEAGTCRPRPTGSPSNGNRGTRTRRVIRDEILRAAVVQLLGKRWSPEQVAHELRPEFPGPSGTDICVPSRHHQATYDGSSQSRV